MTLGAEKAKHIRGRLAAAGIKARCRWFENDGKIKIQVFPPSADARFSDDEQRKILRIMSVNKFTLTRGMPINEHQMTYGSGGEFEFPRELERNPMYEFYVSQPKPNDGARTYFKEMRAANDYAQKQADATGKTFVRYDSYGGQSLIRPKRPNKPMTLKKFPANNAWAFIFGDDIRTATVTTMGDWGKFFTHRKDAVEAARQQGLTVSSSGAVSVKNPKGSRKKNAGFSFHPGILTGKQRRARGAQPYNRRVAAMVRKHRGVSRKAPGVSRSGGAVSGFVKDVAAALINQGYSKPDAQKAAARASGNDFNSRFKNALAGRIKQNPQIDNEPTKKMMLEMIQRRNRGDYSQLPSSFESDAVKAAFADIKYHFPKDAINARVKASKARTFTELNSAVKSIRPTRYNPAARSRRRNSVGTEILAQLGGRRFTTMTGAKHFTSSGNSLSFRLPVYGKNGINGVRITLDSNDTYSFTFYKIRGTNVQTVAERRGVYADNLRETFTSVTRLETSLGSAFERNNPMENKKSRRGKRLKRKKSKTGKMPAGLAAYWAKKRGKKTKSNPRPRRKAKRVKLTTLKPRRGASSKRRASSALKKFPIRVSPAQAKKVAAWWKRNTGGTARVK